jgi:cyclophilin family peptidyl-prolyl cis-trans isomerase
LPSPRKKKIMQATRKRQRRGAVYLVALVIVIATIGIGWYVYASSQSTAQSSPQPNTLPDIVYAKLATSQGTIEIELYHSLTPKTVENFVNLANSGFYNNLVWHRIAKNFVIQTGNSNSKNGLNNSTWSQGGSGQSIPFEYASSLHNAVGYVAMASTGQRVGGSTQFYININDNSGTSVGLDGNYAVFGKVISGMNAAYVLGNLPIYPGLSPTDGQPTNPADAMLNGVTISNSP